VEDHIEFEGGPEIDCGLFAELEAEPDRKRVLAPSAKARPDDSTASPTDSEAATGAVLLPMFAIPAVAMTTSYLAPQAL
jgi:hypothetical protein